jgi:chromosome segregation ATPase
MTDKEWRVSDSEYNLWKTEVVMSARRSQNPEKWAHRLERLMVCYDDARKRIAELERAYDEMREKSSENFTNHVDAETTIDRLESEIAEHRRHVATVMQREDALNKRVRELGEALSKQEGYWRGMRDQAFKNGAKYNALREAVTSEIEHSKKYKDFRTAEILEALLTEPANESGTGLTLERKGQK